VIDRRSFVKTGAAAGALVAMGCDPVVSALTRGRGHGVPAGSLAETAALEVDSTFHLLSRAAFGPWPGDVSRVRAMGAEAWVEEQLAPEAIDDGLCDLRARRFESIHAPAGELFEYRKRVVREELTRATLLRAVYSKRQLLEVMVRFWSDHLNIDISKGACAHLKAADDREVIRRHALGTFRELIGASALSPAMLVYLDGEQNRKRTPEEVPNENYGRELLELHTLGVNGGYTQEDVMEAARCLTGWRVRRKWRKGQVVFEPGAHDDGEKTVLGQTIPAGGGAEDLDRLLDIVCAHPSTARFVSAKLCRRFVSDHPPEALVERVSKVFQDSGGEIKELLRAILGSPEFQAARAVRIKRPFRFVASALRAMAADTHARRPLLEYLQRLGQPLFSYPTPDGYPDEPAPWVGTLLWRWNFAVALATGALPGVKVDGQGFKRALADSKGQVSIDRVCSYLLGRAAQAAELEVFESAWKEDKRLAVGLVLSSPAFQRY
jgi:uncharacterized protein (DUF1800 family)